MSSRGWQGVFRFERDEREPDAPEAGSRRSHGSGQRGETLIEILATVMLLSLSIMAIVGLIYTMTRVTAQHRHATTSNSWAVNLGERIVDPFATDYQMCATTYPVTGVPEGYEAEIVTIRRLADPASPNETWVDMGACSDDGGVQQVTIETWSKRSPDNRERIQVVKRNAECANELAAGEIC